MRNSLYDIEHGLNVAAYFEYEDPAWVTALLHDVIEDTDLNSRFLENKGVPREITEALNVLTRRGQEYDFYIALCAAHPLAALVKAADLQANLARMDEDHAPLRPRYEKALAKLQREGRL